MCIYLLWIEIGVAAKTMRAGHLASGMVVQVFSHRFPGVSWFLLLPYIKTESDLQVLKENLNRTLHGLKKCKPESEFFST